jgi:hypothetical protein
MTDAAVTPAHTVRVPGLVFPGVLAGLAGGVGMAVWEMAESTVTGMGFWTPLNVCMASFVYRGEAAMMMQEAMKNPHMSMNTALVPSHLAVGMVLHLAFSVVVGIAFVTILFGLRRAGLPVLGKMLGNPAGYVVAAIAGGALLYVVMMYLVLPWANPLMPDMTPRVPFFVGHLVYGLLFGVVAYPLVRGASARRAR